MRWITFTERTLTKPRKTRVWDVRPKQNELGWPLGSVSWYAPWRKYCFFPSGDAVFEEDCLREIAQFCVNATMLHKEQRKQAT